MTRRPLPSLRHVARLTDGVGIVEHAHRDRPRRDLGWCTDDAGRALALASTLSADPDARRIAVVCLRFLRRAHVGGGRFRLRRGPHGAWTDDVPSDDACGRALLGLGTAAAGAPWQEVRDEARAAFAAAVPFRSPYPRALAYAVLGAAALLDTDPDDVGAARLLDGALGELPAPASDPEWPWPEPRLTYANAVIPDALLAAGAARSRADAVDAGLALLEWLVGTETRDGRFSFTPVAGRGPGEHGPAFDQQPIEAWAMADACTRALALTGDRRWADAVEGAADWFLGENDTGVLVHDPATGGGFDGLEALGVNRNQGAESTLAFVATMARAAQLRERPQAARDRSAAASASSR